MDTTINLDTACREYADITRDEKALKLRKDFLKEIIQQEVIDSGEPIKKEYGTFKEHRTTRYVYSDTVKEKQAEVDNLKEDEKEQGIAKPETTVSLQFRLKTKKPE